ncbi:MAG: MAPEG family protein [Sphingorhabdus sp.]
MTVSNAKEQREGPDMLSLPITLTIAAGAALVNLWLMMRCGQARGKVKVSIGDGGDEFLIRRMRAHANFVESAPFVLVLIAAIEASRGSMAWLWWVGILFIFGRLAHGLGMDGGTFGKGRELGIIVTMLTLVGLGGYALWIVYSGLA